MSALTERIAEVLRDELERHGLDDMGFDDQHVAERVAAALQLTEENRVVRSICDMADPGIPERRWVSGWTAVEDQP